MTVTSNGWGLAALATGALGLGLGSACSVTPETNTTFDGPVTSSMATMGPGPSDEGTETSSSSGGGDDLDDDGETDPKLDTPFDPGGGCESIDFLFVIDNSESMQTYQLALTDEFPGFITAMYDALPAAVDVHVGLTTTDFDPGCDAIEGTMNCQTDATVAEVQEHYVRPDEMNLMGNGAQGKLFEYGGMRYFETNSNADPAALTSWFSDAAVAAGEEGCSFEMPIAAAGFATHPANFENAGFLRDESALLVIFFLTDEPDKSLESRTVYADMIRQAKSQCGGAGGSPEDCVFVSGLIPECTLGVNQKLWQFMNIFDDEPPTWGDIEATHEYANVFGGALAGAIAEACANVPIP